MLPVISWWLAIQFFGLAALPLSWRLFARLPGRGYPFAKVLGLLLVSYLLWLGASFRLLPNTSGGILFALCGVAGLSAALGREGLRRDADGRRPLFVWFGENRSLVIATELLFLLIFAGWSAFRAYNPDIAGTEKPMEFAFVNGILGSRFFPPQDPWLSGYGISYYYFGYIMLAVLVRLTGVLPEIGFNLGVALWYALTMISAFGVVYTLVALSRSDGDRQVPSESESASLIRTPVAVGRAPIGWGLLGAFCLGFMANLEGLIDTAYQRGLLPLNIINWFNIKGLTDSPPTGNWTGGFWWWWRASRVIHDLTLPDALGQRVSVEVIDEFPFFSFLLGDLHPHVLALPFVLLAILFCLNLLVGALAAEPRPESGGGFLARMVDWARTLVDAVGLSWGGILLYAVVLGSLAFLNTWDFPIYVGLAALALGMGMALRSGLNRWSIGRAALAFILLAALGCLVYAPFYIGFQSQLGGILPNLLFPSRFAQFFVMFGSLLVVAVFFLLLLCHCTGSRATMRTVLLALPWTLLLPLFLLALVVLGIAALPQGQAFVREALQRPEIAANVSDASFGGLLRLVLQVRVGLSWTYFVLAVLLAWVIGAAWVLLRRESVETFARRSAESLTVPIDLFALLLILVALALALFPEFLYMRDMFGSRMNTVFKFYYQAWVLLALASAYGLSRLAAASTPRTLKIPVLVLASLLVLGGLWYPLAAIPSKVDNFQGQPTLDGLAYLRRDNPADMAAIDWLRANVRHDAVVLEATGGSYSPEGAGRVSMSTGNPTLLGWDFHERQWRGNAGYDKLAAARPAVIDQIYRSAQGDQLPGILEQWDVDYIYIGNLERNKYGISDASFARFDANLRGVYDVDGVRIYAR